MTFSQQDITVGTYGGYDVIELFFTDFDPTETFTFSIDIDSTTVQGSDGGMPGGAISGFELMGSYVEVEFEDGSIQTGMLNSTPVLLTAYIAC